MRRGTWILAISGMMALQQSGFAADPAADQPTGRIDIGGTRNSAAATGRSAKSAAEPKTKNYYKDLFGNDETSDAQPGKKYLPASAPSQAGAESWSGDSQSSASPNAPAKSVMKNSTLSFDELSGTDAPAADVPPSGRKAQAAADKPKPNAKVVQAVYDKPAGKRIAVQQIRSDSRPRSAPPVVGFDENADNAAQTASPKTPTTRTAVVHAEPMTAAPVQAASTEAQTSQVTVEWVKRGEFNVGQECLVDLVVKNAGNTMVSQVAIDAFFPTNVRLTAAEPRPAAATDRLTWNLEQLAPASEQRICVKLVPSRRGEIAASAQVRFTGSSSASFAVHEPMLKVAVKTSSKEIMLGDPTSQMITVTNPGTGTAQDVKIEAKLSEGLEHPTRENRLVIDVGSVGPGETRTYRLGLTAAKGGMQSVEVVATSRSEAPSSDSVQFSVIAPSLKIAVDGPALRYKGRNAKYTLTITNDGSLANDNIQVSQTIAEGFKFVGADRQGKFDSSAKTVQWFIGRLEPGEATQVNCELHCHQIGEFAHAVQVASDTGVRADAKVETRVDGIASLTMELVDFDDPVETGSETAYEIRVKNDGSKAATGVVLTCELPAGMELLSAKAPVDRFVEGRQLTFKAIDQIAPGSQVTIRIQMKVVKDGSHRLRARLSGGGLQEPMQLEESTRAYSDGPN